MGHKISFQFTVLEKLHLQEAVYADVALFCYQPGAHSLVFSLAAMAHSGTPLWVV